MNRFIIMIDPKYENELMKVAIITWKSSLVKGLYYISSNNDIKFLKAFIPYVRNIVMDNEEFCAYNKMY